MRFWSSASVVLFTCLATVSCGSNAELIFPFDTADGDAGIDVSVETGTPIDDNPLDDGGQFGCTRLSCADQGIECGPAGDGCGDVIECGSCTAPETCGGGGEYSKCGGSAGCVPRTCDDIGAATCGPVADGCGNLIQCGDCTFPDTCGGGGAASQCGRANVCTPKTCASFGPSTCGPQSDGCGGIIDCSSCTLPELCGGDPTKPGQCAVPEMPDGGVDGGDFCTPKSCDDYGDATCGPQGDGCGGVLQCGSCTSVGELCGGDPTKPGQCGLPPATCTPKTSCNSGECGPVSNGCGGVLQCAGCPNGQQCGGPGKPSQCVPVSQCTKMSCADYPAGTCGQQSDGCGGVITCASCTGVGEECGGDPSKPGICAVPPPVCVPKTCAELGVQCGPAGDGCGGTIPSCGTCGNDERCGGPGKPSQCVPVNDCTRRTCAELGFECGMAPDGCGGALNCWPDPANPRCPEAHEACIGNPAVCVAGTGGGCSGPLCGALPSCGQNPTILSGRVTSPNGSLRVPNAIVYIPRNPTTALPAISTGPSCDRCEDEDLGPVLAAAVTDHKGDFTLKGDIPVDVNFNIVVKSGKWRGVRQISAGVVTGCSDDNDIGDTYTRLPAHGSDGLAGTHLPHIAIATGDADAMECVFYKMGVSQSEFTNRNGGGSIHLYRANGAMIPGPNPNPCSHSTRSACNNASCDASEAACRACHNSCNWNPFTDDSSPASDLTSRFDQYDLVVWDCEGTERTRSSADRTSIRNFINAGGRFFASHWSSDWIKDNPGLTDITTWGTGSASSATGNLSFERPRGNTSRLRTFARWLHNEGAASVTFTGGEPTAGSFTIQDPRDNARTVSSNAEEWVYRSITGGTSAQTFSFNTPVGATGDNICGRVTYSGFHVAEGFGSGGAGNQYFPNHCSGGLTNQEKVLAYMLFDLAACVSEGEPPQPPTCTPLTKVEACEGGLCGTVSNGCGGVVNCGGCPAGEYCSATNVCVSPTCSKLTCADFPDTCGRHSDGCGDLTPNCGTCTLPETCGGGGVPNQCGTPSCQKLSCGDIGAGCGIHGDGCGGTISCGACQAPETCGGGGVPNQCGGVGCTKATCESLGVGCGTHGDGCGGTIVCDPCQAPDTCGGGGVPNQCGHSTCVARSCEEQGIECGPAGDGCGGEISTCGSCTWPETCGGGGIPGQCGVSDGGLCQPITCADQGLECGPAGNGCGGILDCGKCQAPETCGGAGVPGECGHIACVPKTCEEVGVSCGPAGDGCGGTLECGTCDAPETCGGGGVPGQCGKPDCTPRTCQQAGVNCGVIGDGCGGTVSCGTCQAPQTCGGGGKPGVCGGGVK